MPGPARVGKGRNPLPPKVGHTARMDAHEQKPREMRPPNGSALPLTPRGRLLDPVREQAARQARDLKRRAAGTVGADHVEIVARDEQVLAVG
jgi:hypothetical protein